MPSIIQLDNAKDNVWTVQSGEILEATMMSWDGTEGVPGDYAYAQLLYMGEVVYNKAIPYKDGRYLDLPYLGVFTEEISIKIDKPGCTIIFFTRSLGRSE